ncbi:hypothetical protein AWA2045_31050 (plasmid) [Lactiplantibacillus plantarum]|nr:hypothetical protein AWA2045_17560 [Lactiplantibacillus plantarum]BEI54974.1 hypothetical protein AWA2045_31050 [Lactiplantibacillus plantarum]
MEEIKKITANTVFDNNCVPQKAIDKKLLKRIQRLEDICSAKSK